MTERFRPHRVDWTPDKVGRFWDYLSRHDAGEFFSEKYSHDLASRLLRAARPALVLDIGCGTGPLVAELARRRIRAIGIDSSPEVLAAARGRSLGLSPEPEFHLGSVSAIPLPDHSVDAATLIEVAEHLDDTTLASALAETRRVLRRGGILMLTTPNDEDLASASRQCPDCGAEFHVYQHVRRWTMNSLAETLKTAGFASVRVSEADFVEDGSLFERLVPVAHRVLRRKPPRLLALAMGTEGEV